MRGRLCDHGAILGDGGQKSEGSSQHKADPADGDRGGLLLRADDVQRAHPGRHHRPCGGQRCPGGAPGAWAACICTSIALAIQALLFGDGGITSFGFNCFNMALVIPFVTYFIYQWMAGKSEVTSPKRWIWARHRQLHRYQRGRCLQRYRVGHTAANLAYRDKACLYIAPIPSGSRCRPCCWLIC